MKHRAGSTSGWPPDGRAKGQAQTPRDPFMDEPELSAVQVRHLQSAKSGDVDAFGELVNVNYPDVRVFMAMHLGNQSDLDDLVQDVFVRAFAGLNTLRETTTFRSWLRSIARNRVLEYLRERIRTATADNNTLELLL